MALMISEMFGPVLQGEGVTSGVPAFFLRFATCNLMCGGHGGALVAQGKASWWCDTEAVWKQGRPYEVSEIVDFMRQQGELERILAGTTHLVLTGGEPTLPTTQQAIVSLLDFLQGLAPDVQLYTELETNGTRYTEGFYQRITQINCSPKLANSGVPAAMRIVPSALKEIVAHPNSWFKFVISELSDWEQIEQDYLPYLQRERIVLMPAGSDLEDLEVTSKVVWQLATRENVRACNRLQVITWRKSVGV